MIRAAASGVSYEIPATVDLVALYRTVRRLHLSSFLYSAASGINDPRVLAKWEEDRRLEELKDLLQNEEIGTITCALSAKGIKFAFLKGAVLKQFWGETAFRYMGDIDFYYEGNDRDLRRALEEVGYSARLFTRSDFNHHLVFNKEPWFVLEPHYALFNFDDPYFSTLSGILERATPDPLVSGLYCLSPEDLYLHCLLHLRKHIASRGIGVRSFLDFAFILRKHPDLSDRERVKQTLQDAGLNGFETRVLRIVRLLSDPAVTPDKEDERELSTLFDAGLFGSLENSVGNSVETVRTTSRFPRFRYLLKRMLPPLGVMSHHRFRAPLSWIVYPFFWFRRLFAILFSKERRKNTTETIRCLSSYREKEKDAAWELRYFDLLPQGENGKENQDD